MSREIRELTGGKAISTIRGKISASNCFSQFLNVAAATSIDNIEEQELRNPALLRRYATFLVDHFVTGDDDRLMCDSAKQYLCGRTGYTGPTGRTGPRHDPPDPSAYSTHTSLVRLAS